MVLQSSHARSSGYCVGDECKCTSHQSPMQKPKHQAEEDCHSAGKFRYLCYDALSRDVSLEVNVVIVLNLASFVRQYDLKDFDCHYLKKNEFNKHLRVGVLSLLYIKCRN